MSVMQQRVERRVGERRVGASGQVSLSVIRQRTAREHAGLVAPRLSRGVTLRDIVKYALPSWAGGEVRTPYPEVARQVNAFRRANASRLLTSGYRVATVQALRVSAIQSALWLDVLKADGMILPLGLVGVKLVTDVGVGFIVDAFQNSVELENMKFHALGTGSTAENAADTALVTELTTEYTGNVRATGTTTEGGGPNVYRSVGTNTLDGTPGAALREHGLMSQAATGGGVLFDRTVFAAITLSSGDGLQSTYDGTFASGG